MRDCMAVRLRRRSKTERSRLALSEQIQHLLIKLVAAELLVLNVTTLAVEHAEATLQVPERPAPARFLPQRQAIPHPGQHHLVRRAIERAPFTDVDAHALLLKLLPGLDAFLGHG